MNAINFNSNQFSFLSEEVRLAMDEANIILKSKKPISFGVDYKIMAETENARNFIAESLKLKAHEVFFSNGNTNSNIEIINHAIFFLNTENIFTSIFEDSQKLEYLQSLHTAGKINLIIIETSEFGETNIDKLKEKLTQTKSKSLLSLSHANLYTGVLLPIKEIATACFTNQVYFHLDANLTMGRYQIDFQNIKPDFISFDGSLMNGPIGIGVQIISDKIQIDNQNYHYMINNFKNCENKNLAQIMGFFKAFSVSLGQLDENRLKLIKLKQYLIEKANHIQSIKPLDVENKKLGLINMIPLYIDKNMVGNYLIEKLELQGIFVPNLKYPIDLDTYSNHQFINIALNVENTEVEINYLMDTIGKFQK